MSRTDKRIERICARSNGKRFFIGWLKLKRPKLPKWADPYHARHRYIIFVRVGDMGLYAHSAHFHYPSEKSIVMRRWSSARSVSRPSAPYGWCTERGHTTFSHRKATERIIRFTWRWHAYAWAFQRKATDGPNPLKYVPRRGKEM